MYQNNFNGYLPTQQRTGLKGHPVSSLDEVRAAQIDFDGSVALFPDFANNKIYTKQINLNGTASLNMYTLTELPKTENQYVTKEEFNSTLKDIRDALASLTQSPKETSVFDF